MTKQTARERIAAKFTVGAANAIREFDISEHDMYCLLIAAEKNAMDDCGKLAGITRVHIESAARTLGILKAAECSHA